MIPIVINENQKFDENNFKDFLIQTCKQHKIEGRALAFAFIVYDFDNHTINDILEKKNYWNTLDKISGKTLSVFYINSQDSYYNQRQEEIYQDELQQRERNSQSGTISFLVPITRKPTPTDNAIGFVKSEFKLDYNIKTPFVLFFQIDNDDNISDSFIVVLKQDRLEEAFLELRDHIKNAVESLAKVLPENYINHQEIFNLIKSGVNSGKFYYFINKKVKPKLGIGSIISLVKLIAGVK
jgi:hypothetical protein